MTTNDPGPDDRPPARDPWAPPPAPEPVSDGPPPATPSGPPPAPADGRPGPPPAPVGGVSPAPAYGQPAPGGAVPSVTFPSSGRPWEPLAIIGFVLAVTCLSIPAAIVSFIALRRIRRSGARGRGLAIAGLVLSVLGALLVATVVAITVLVGNAVVDANDDAPEAGGGPGPVVVNDLAAGDCVARLPRDVTADLQRVVCTAAHEAQVVHRFALPDGDYPGTASVERTAEDTCTGALAPEVGTRVGDGEIGLVYYYPQRSTWLLGDRDVVCIAVSEDQPFTTPLPVQP